MKEIFDPIRNKNVILTPEEEVRQRVLAWLLDFKGYPKHSIDVEVPMSRFNTGSTNRVDILVTLFNKGSSNPEYRLLVECKRPEVDLTSDIQLQVQRYLLDVPAEYVMITNGVSAVFLKRESGKYTYTDDVPAFQ